MRNDVFRIKVEFEDVPITDMQVRGLKNVKKLFRDIEDKMGGKQ